MCFRSVSDWSRRRPWIVSRRSRSASNGQTISTLIGENWRAFWSKHAGANRRWNGWLGLGVNVRPPENVTGAAGLEPGTDRLDVLGELIPGIRAAAQARGPLRREEIEEFNARDLARGRKCIQPALGRVAGISAAGELLVALADSITPFRSGSLVLEEMS